MVYACPSHNTRLAQKCLFGIFGFRKTPFGLRPLRHFATPHFACPAKPSVSLIRAGKTSVTLNVKCHLPKIFGMNNNKINVM